MVEYIDREALIQELDAKLCALHGELDENRIVYDAFTDGFEECVGEVEKFQFTADVAPVMHGKWEKWEGDDRHHCSVCECYANAERDSYGYITFEFLDDYCPNCGADMKGQDAAALGVCQLCLR